MAAVGAHRYWRIQINSINLSNYGHVGEVELRTSAGGEDVTTPSTVVTASSTAGSAWEASRVVDNNVSTDWAGANVAGVKWLTFDLVTPTAVAEVAIHPGTTYPTEGPKGVQIAYSDDGTNYTIATAEATLVGTATWQTVSVEQAPPDPNTPQKTVPTMTVDSAVGWTSPNNVLTSDNARASKVVTNPSSNIITLNWTDTLPANAILLGCVLKVEGYASSTSSSPSIRNCYFVASGTNGSITSYQLLSTTETTYTFGSATVLPSGFTSASRPTSVTVRTYQDTNTSTTHYIDYIGVELWWKLPGGGVNVLFLGECF